MKISIFTSYYANIKKLPDTILPISISIFPPKYLQDIDSEKLLAPSDKILTTYKSSQKNNLDRKHYIKTFKEEILNNINLKEILNNLEELALNNNKTGIALLCFEQPNDFCHRQIVAEAIEIELNLDKNSIKEHSLIDKKNERDYKNYRYFDDTFKLAIIGSRTFNNYPLLEREVLRLLDKNNVPLKQLTIVSGGAKGADSLGEKFADNNKCFKDIYFANWQPDGKNTDKSAGYKRNIDIIDNSNLVIAFTNGSKGTAHSIKLAEQSKKDCLIIPFIENSQVNFNLSSLTKITKKTVSNNPDKIFIFSSSLEGGKKGTSIISDLDNSFGIPICKNQKTKEGSFFDDKSIEDLDLIKSKLRELYIHATNNNNITFPLFIGKDFFDLEEENPLIFKEINNIIDTHFFLKG